MLTLPPNLNKNAIRSICKDIRDRLENRNDLSQRMWQNLLRTNIYSDFKNFLIYASIGSEPNTNMLIEKALKDGKAVYCPKITDNDMDFYRIKDVSELEAAGRYHIPEPRNTDPSLKYETVIDTSVSDTICIIPALCVDQFGHRLGYGGGFYDRYFGKETVGNDRIFPVCAIFSALFTDYLPYSTYDMIVKTIITEDGIYNTEVSHEQRRR
jgi:5,10-methenyltetrahydrofolate synthetase